MTTFPNAKLNIGLDILSKRSDGYHDIDTLMVPYKGLADKLEIEEASKFAIEIIKDGKPMKGNAPGEWDPMSDLSVKAYRLLDKDFRLPKVKIRLEKHIPVGAGLGGGSADGAFALVMLSEMFNLFLPDEVLEDYASNLGSDCAFFIRNSPALARGRGEILEEFDASFLDEYRLEVIVPQGISVSTKQAYASVVPCIPELRLEQALKTPVEQWKGVVKNDFEKSVFEIYPELEVLKEDIYKEGAVYASMSGSGSALYGIFRK